ncbi:MAG: bifunctional aldolase/short-chain dehydrogenase [Magnetococcales bacterium]|nr:bifunctional aldolase/short-chain dehydrogenase [Magnetococcales bacterium]
MKNLWSEEAAQQWVDQYAPRWGEPLALRTYSSRLLGSHPELVLHGGGNTSVKGDVTDIFGQTIAGVFIKASGVNLAQSLPTDHPALNLNALQRLTLLNTLSPSAMVNQLRLNLFDSSAPTPSIEALLHAFLPPIFIDHTHPDALLTLGNQPDGRQRLKDALGAECIILDYIHPGFELAKAVLAAWEAQPNAIGMVLLHHGLLTWGDSVRKSYEATLTLVNRAEQAINAVAKKVLPVPTPAAPWWELAPVLRGALAEHDEDSDRSYKRFIVRSLDDSETLSLLHQPDAAKLFVSAPLTSDHLIRCKPWPLWIDNPGEIREAVQRYREDYRNYFQRHAASLEGSVQPLDSSPRVVLIPGVGGFVAGESAHLADVARDITRQTLRVKTDIARMGSYCGLEEQHLFAMEYFSLQHAKLVRHVTSGLQGCVAIVTGAAGAIGSGICRRLLQEGAHVAATDLPGDALDTLVQGLAEGAPGRIMGVAMDVTDEDSVTQGIQKIVQTWGGIDCVIINAGLAHVAPLASLGLETFRKLYRVNVEGTLLLLSHMARLFERQRTGGDVVVISTKNVFAPGASFGAYSATKAASHQLARIASLELAPLDVRVNMVAPDAVFSDGARKSGLWAEVGPDRMRARGLDEAGLENYYRNRNLLKARVTADHVANAVLFFVTRKTPTTGATIPVDGGLPDATPR